MQNDSQELCQELKKKKKTQPKPITFSGGQKKMEGPGPLSLTAEGRPKGQPEPCPYCLPWAPNLRHLEGLLAGLELIPLLGLDHNYSNFLTELGSRTV